MTADEWASSNDAPAMLAALYQLQPLYFESQIRSLHRFLIACCWKHRNLIAQEGLTNGLRGAERWLAGEIDDTELDRLNWYAEAEAFAIDYAKSPGEIAELKSFINGIEEVRDMPFSQARALLKRAAYFAEGSMIYPRFDSRPWVGNLFTSDFLCPDLLREHLHPEWR
jgi:hypothetical protein